MRRPKQQRNDYGRLRTGAAEEEFVLASHLNHQTAFDMAGSAIGADVDFG